MLPGALIKGFDKRRLRNLLALFFIGAGRFFSMDYWIRRAFMR